MAINVNIPGIGTVSVDGVASEDTMKQLLNTMKSMNRTMTQRQRQPSGGGGGPAPTMQAANNMNALITATRNQIQQVGALGKAFSGTMSILKTLGSGVGSILKDIAKTGLAVTTAWMTSADVMAENPIRAGAEMINTGIDLMAKAVTTATDAISKIAGGIPLIGGLFKGAGEAFKAAVELASTVFKVANEFMAAEFQKTVEAFGKLNRVGATFAGGMDELNDIVTASGIPMSKFADAIVNSRENITAMGLNVASASKLVANGMSRLATTTGVSGKALREELLLLGYNYQEQGELVAEYTANMVAAGKNRAEIDRDVATGTAKYAKDLKILSDITGEDARKRMAEARRESMRASLMNQLTEGQREAFRKVYAAAAQAGPEVQEAIVQKLAIGEVINPSVAMNETIMNFVTSAAESVTTGSKTAMEDTLTALSRAAQDLRDREKDLGTAIDIAKIAGATGVVGTAADIFNRIAAIQMTPEQIREATENVDRNTRNAGQTGEAFSAATKATNDFAVAMGDLARKNMPEYAGLIARATTETTAALNAALAEANKIGRVGIKAYSEEKAEELKNQLDDSFRKFQTFLTDDFLPKMAATIEGALPWWLGGTKGKTEKIVAETQRQGEQSSAIAAGDLGTAADVMQGTAEAPEIQAEGGILNFLGRMFGRMQKRATGGTVSGPDTGYPVLLHGTEAVVPLPDGRSIPVEISQRIDASSAVNTAKLEDLVMKQTEQVVALTNAVREMITVAQEHRDISRDMYDVTA